MRRGPLPASVAVAWELGGRSCLENFEERDRKSLDRLEQDDSRIMDIKTSPGPRKE